MNKLTKYFKIILLIVLTASISTSCTNTEIGDSRDIEPNAIAQQIDVIYKQDETPYTQIKFRVSGVNGTTLVLNKPAQVSFDGQLLNVDSSNYSGAYYRANIAASADSRTFIYTDKNGKTYKNAFTFSGFALYSPVPDAVNRNEDFKLKFKGIPVDAQINFDLRDTSTGGSVSGENKLVNGELLITKNQLSKLKPGPITIELGHMRKDPLQSATPEGGEINHSYILRKIKTKLL